MMSKRKSKRKYSVSGKVIDRTKNKDVSGLRVEAWDKDVVEDDLLGTATTNKKGVFSITFDDSKFADELHDEAPDIYFKVYYSKRLILSTEKNVLWNVSKDIKDLKLQVVMPTKDVVKFEEKAPPAPVVKPSIKDSEDLPSTHEQPKDEAKPSPAPLSVTGVIR
ncbi:MAG: hypothetical protein KAU48_10530, partial [Candidatus Thorarchaeota archaeon]|nr:hypothetical protein [Candidatus Thorarchaeota archaeon]